MHRHFLPLLLWSVVCLVAPATVSAVELNQVQQALAQPIIGSQWTLAEAQRYAEQRIARMPELTTRQQWQEYSTKLRDEVLANVVLQGEAAGWRDAKSQVEWQETLEAGDGYRIRKLRYEALPGLWIPALLYEPLELDGKVPVVLNVNGHDGNGRAAGYKQVRCINQAKRGMIALNVEWLSMGQLRVPGNEHSAMNQLDLCGTSGVAPFFLSMSRGIDVLLSHKHADPDRLAVAGLSGGGWQTIFISSLDTRVKLANPVAGYSSFFTRARHFKDLGDSEQTPNDLALYADYTHLTAMLAPRAALLTFNQSDNCCFEAPTALPPLLNAAEPVYRLYDKADFVQSHVNVAPGTHNFEQDNREALYRMVHKFFYDGQASFDPSEIECSAELKSKSDIEVALPEDNLTLNKIAVRLSQSLPLNAELPTDKTKATKWQQTQRKELDKVLRSDRDDYQLTAELHDSYTRGNVRVAQWRLKIGDWTVPAVELTPPNAAKSVIVVHDEGREKAAESVHSLVDSGHRVLALDPFYFGESKVSQKDYLFALLVASTGRRPLGIQANQLAAAARWMQQSAEGRPVHVQAFGPRSSLFALTSAAIEPAAIGSVELHGSLGSLKEVVERNQLVTQTPEVFCFGLLKQCDILQLAALVAPREVAFREPHARLATELESLPAFYELLGQPFDPLSSE